ncbi:hypothetical protein VB741_23620 [Leptothoe sp. PORK10 BA2]|nr:hypothetical protein [Leptothoe sp. PORK10 BA2]
MHAPDGDTQFTVSNPSALNIGSLLLEGTLGEFGVTDNSIYTSISSYITGFQFLGEEATFNLNASETVLFGFANGSIFTLDSELSGDIIDLDGNILGTAVGSLSSVQSDNQIGNFFIDLEGTPINPETTDSQSVPGPSLLFGLIVLAISALWQPTKKLPE